MKHLCLLTVLLMLPVTTAAQQRSGRDQRSQDRRSTDRGSDRRPADQGSSRTTGPWWEKQQTPWWERQQTPWWEQQQIPKTPSWLAGSAIDPRPHQGNNERRSSGHRSTPGVIYVLPPYRYFPETLPGTNQFVVTPPAPTEWVPPNPPAPTGFLTLDVEPNSAQVFVDGVYLGAMHDVGSELRLVTGTHRIELRARGYQTLAFGVEISEDRPITYRGALERDPAAAPPPAPIVNRPPAPTGPQTMYMIQGCYLGNVRPKASELRAGCDINRLQTITP